MQIIDYYRIILSRARSYAQFLNEVSYAIHYYFYVLIFDSLIKVSERMMQSFYWVGHKRISF